jgi:hypothetical protein
MILCILKVDELFSSYFEVTVVKLVAARCYNVGNLSFKYQGSLHRLLFIILIKMVEYFYGFARDCFCANS